MPAGGHAGAPAAGSAAAPGGHGQAAGLAADRQAVRVGPTGGGTVTAWAPDDIDLVIFDCDGVLVDSELISSAVLVDLAARHGADLTDAYVTAHCLGRSFPTVARAIAEDFGLTLPPDFEATYRTELLARFTLDLSPTPGVAEVLRRLARPQCVATSSSPPRAAHSLAVTGLAGLVGPVFTASEVARGKPAPDLFLHAAARMGARPDRCLVIEDSAPGLAAADAAGMRGLLFAGGAHHRRAAGGLALAAPPGVAVVRDWATFAAAWPGLLRGPADVGGAP